MDKLQSALDSANEDRRDAQREHERVRDVLEAEAAARSEEAQGLQTDLEAAHRNGKRLEALKDQASLNLSRT